mgnify:CR=1 FL=1
MSWEAQWYNEQCPKIKNLAAADRKDPTVPIRLALGFTLGAAGYRSVQDLKGNGLWFWPRRTGNWWAIPPEIDQAIRDEQNAAIEAACSVNGSADTAQIAEVLRRKLKATGFPTSIDDTRVNEVIFPVGDGPDPLSRKVRRIVSGYKEERNRVADDPVQSVAIDWALIEISLPTGTQRERGGDS